MKRVKELGAMSRLRKKEETRIKYLYYKTRRGNK